MIDIHSHVLPSVDDGSKNDEESLFMLKTAEEQGVTDMIFTPHCNCGFTADRFVIEDKFKKFKTIAKNAGINVSLYLGQEIHVIGDISGSLKKGEFLTLNGSKYALTEFSFHEEQDIVETAYMLKLSGYVPVIAHLERYFYSTVETAQEVRELGGLVQINANSICAKEPKNKPFKKKAWSLLRANAVDVVAGDVHISRVYRMAEAYSLVAKKFGKERAEDLFVNNPKKILNDE